MMAILSPPQCVNVTYIAIQTWWTDQTEIVVYLVY